MQVRAALSAVASFFFIPYYPFWSILVISLDVFVIWRSRGPGPRQAESTRKGDEMADLQRQPPIRGGDHSSLYLEWHPTIERSTLAR